MQRRQISIHRHRAGIAIAMLALTAALVPVPSVAALTVQSRLGPTGIGPIVAGATPSGIASVMPFTTSAAAAGSSCYYLQPVAPMGVRFLVEFGTIRRAEVGTPAISTVDGFRVGDARKKLQMFYGSRAVLAPGKYDVTSETLTVSPARPEAAKFRLIYVLARGVVRAIYGGALPQVAYVEGCS